MAEPNTTKLVGRPRNTTPLEKLPLLTIPQVMALAHQLGRRVSRACIMDAIQQKRLAPRVDDLHHDRFGQPVIKILRKDLDSWLNATLRPLNVA